MDWYGVVTLESGEVEYVPIDRDVLLQLLRSDYLNPILVVRHCEADARREPDKVHGIVTPYATYQIGKE